VRSTPPAPREPAAALPQEKAAPAAGPRLEWRGAMQDDWLSWRGPGQDGVSPDVCPPSAIDPAKPLWSVPLSGRGTPVVADGLVYVMAYTGEDATCLEEIVCLDERDGSIVWRDAFPDFLTDVVYSRYAISSPTIDPETGNVYCQIHAGRLVAYTRAGKKLWEHSLMEEYGKLTFPNGRTGAPLVVDDKVIVHVVNANWGTLARASDRFFAFDKKTGECIWGNATPGDTPIDNSFSMPVVEERGGRHVLYAETGCGHVVCIDVETGESLWRFRMATGAAQASPVISGDYLIAIHGGENLDSSTQGRMIALKRPAVPAAGPKGIAELEPAAEAWRADIEAFSSSPVLAGGRVYQTDEDGELWCLDADTGRELWKKKLAPDQVHASPLFCEGKLYVPMNNGSFWILGVGGAEPEVLDTDQFEGNILGAPAIANGRLYVHTTSALYCFGAAEQKYPDKPVAAKAGRGAPGEAVRLQIVPGDFVIEAGHATTLRVRSLDAAGRVVADPVSAVAFETQLPIKDRGDGTWAVAADAKPAAGTLKATAGTLATEARVRIVPTLPWKMDFEDVVLDQPKPDAPAEQRFGLVPSHWLSARPKWDVRERDGSKVISRVMDNPLLQRTITLIGSPDDANYTVAADVMIEGNRRLMSFVGLINQRYLVQLRGNYQDLEVSSNFESLKVHVPFEIKVGTWYSLETRVDVQPDGSTVVRARCWERGSEKPSAWTIEVPHQHGHHNGAAGIYGFTPQSRFKVHIDNLQVTPNE
jgi:outer membrane protein assembly factor BamB